MSRGQMWLVVTTACMCALMLIAGFTDLIVSVASMPPRPHVQTQQQGQQFQVPDVGYCPPGTSTQACAEMIRRLADQELGVNP